MEKWHNEEAAIQRQAPRRCTMTGGTSRCVMLFGGAQRQKALRSPQRSISARLGRPGQVEAVGNRVHMVGTSQLTSLDGSADRPEGQAVGGARLSRGNAMLASTFFVGRRQLQAEQTIATARGWKILVCSPRRRWGRQEKGFESWLGLGVLVWSRVSSATCNSGTQWFVLD